MSLVSVQYRCRDVIEFRLAVRRNSHIGNGWVEISKMAAEPAEAVRENLAGWERMFPKCVWKAEPLK